MRSRFHCSVYRVLFVSAVLTREHLEPLFLAPIQGPPGCLSRLIRLSQDDDLIGLTEEDIAYLEKFPVYDLEAYGFEASREMWEPAFGDLASWLLNDIETAFTNVSSPKVLALGIDAPELGRLQEVTFFLAAYGYIRDKLFNKDFFYPDSDQITPPPPLPGRVQNVSVAMLGTLIIVATTGSRCCQEDIVVVKRKYVLACNDKTRKSHPI